jgi:hypothetical protein
MAGVKPTGDICRAPSATVVLRQAASQQWNQTTPNELGNGDSRLRRELPERLSLLIGELNLGANHDVQCLHAYT